MGLPPEWTGPSAAHQWPFGLAGVRPQETAGGNLMLKVPYFFEAKSISRSTRQGKKSCTLYEAAQHNCRELKAERGSYGRVDPTRSRFNDFLVGPTSAAEIVAQAKDDSRVPDRSGRTPRYDHSQAIELLFSLPFGFNRDVRPFFVECVTWAQKAFSGHQIYSAVIHYDEGPPHCHVLISPIRCGVRVGSEVIDRPSLGALKDKFWCEVAAPSGLTMPPPKLKGERKRKAVQDVTDYLRRERLPCTESRLWPVIEAAIASNPAMSLHLLNLRLDHASRT